MGYSLDLSAAVRRHLAAARRLDEPTTGSARPHRSVAGYLYGIAAECALKHIMRKIGMKIPSQPDGPFYAHFPELKTMLRDAASGRYANVLRKYAEDNALLNEWDVKMRYAPAKEILPQLVDRWREQSVNLVNDMEAYV
jgi:hypothetical protein